MNKQAVLQEIEFIRIIPVIRTGTKEGARELVSAIVEGGIRCVEITMSVPNAVDLISELNTHFGSTLTVGAGTVLDKATARNCIDAGAAFIVTPFLNFEVIEFCVEAEVLICAGALTPTEIFAAWQAGADVVKVFPVRSMGGADYLKALRAPFPDIKLLPTGGVTVDNAAEFLNSGAMAVGVGGAISNWDILNLKGRTEIVNLARRFYEIACTR